LEEDVKLIATIPHDENFTLTQQIIERYSYTKHYIVRLCPPNLIKYEFPNIGEYGGKLLKNALENVYAGNVFKEHCKFEVIN
jgi:hypothetical protein